MEPDRRCGFTLIELVMVVAIVGILAASTAQLMLFLVQSGIYLPNQANVEMIAAEALDRMIDGDIKAGGLRWGRRVLFLRRNRIVFVDHEGRIVDLRWNPLGRMLRSVNGGPAEPLVSYAGKGIRMSGKGGRVFTGYDAFGRVTTDPRRVRAVTVALVVWMGSGSFQRGEGRVEALSGAAVPRYL